MFVPSRNSQAKEIVDRHLHSLPVSDIDEITYVGKLSLFANQISVENLHVEADRAYWNQIEFSDIDLKVSKIEYDAKSAFWQKRLNIIDITGIEFSGFTTYDNISSKLADASPDLIDPTLRREHGRLALRAYFSPIKMRLDFIGDIALTPKGKLEYRIENILDIDGKSLSRNVNRSVLNEPFDLTVPILIMRKEIAIDDFELTIDGVRISGHSIDGESIE